MMAKIVFHNQRELLESRWIAKNIVMAQEVIQKVHKHQGKNWLTVLKVDLKKAYDQLEWKFIDKALQA